MTAQRVGVKQDSVEAVVQSTIARLSAAGAIQSARQTQVRENAGRIAQQLLKLACRDARSLGDLVIGFVVFPGGDLENVTLHRPRFHDVEFRRVDLTRTAFRSGSAEGTSFFEVIVDHAVLNEVVSCRHRHEARIAMIDGLIDGDGDGAVRCRPQARRTPLVMAAPSHLTVPDPP